jgi:probable F420-dependent oxidoreductase
MTVTIGLTVSPQHGEMSDMRNCWMTAEELGVDALYTADHFTAMIVDQDQATRTDSGGDRGKPKLGGKNFEGSSIEAAMAATTSRARIGCICHPVGFRNFNLLADMARTVDHLSNGRSILGLGTGFLRADFEEYGYDFGTQISRAQDLARAVPIIKKRLGKLNPPPTRKLPLLIASMGEKIGMRVVAEHADIWHVFGPIDTIRTKIEVLRRLCDEVGRDFNEIELTTNYWPQILGTDDDPSIYLAEGINHLVLVAEGPKWDLGQLREILAWRDSLSNS